MARSKFPVDVLTPEGKVFEDEVEMVSTRTVTGSIGVLANHAPLMAILEPTELRLYKSDSDIVRFAQGEGYLQVVENSALVLVEEAGRARGQALRGVPRGGRLLVLFTRPLRRVGRGFSSNRAPNSHRGCDHQSGAGPLLQTRASGSTGFSRKLRVVRSAHSLVARVTREP